MKGRQPKECEEHAFATRDSHNGSTQVQTEEIEFVARQLQGFRDARIYESEDAISLKKLAVGSVEACQGVLRCAKVALQAIRDTFVNVRRDDMEFRQ